MDPRTLDQVEREIWVAAFAQGAARRRPSVIDFYGASLIRCDCVAEADAAVTLFLGDPSELERLDGACTPPE